MKQMKFVWMAVMAVVLGVGLTSCLSSDNGDYADIIDDVVLKTPYSAVYYCPRYGYTVNIVNASSYFPDGNYPERGLFYLKLVEGQDIVEGKNTYDVTLMTGSAGFVIKELCNKTDTLLEESAIISQLGASEVSEGFLGHGYINMTFMATLTNETTLEMFNLYPSDVDKEGRLCFTLHHDEDFKYGMNDQTVFMIWETPSWHELKSGSAGDKNSLWIDPEKIEQLEFFGANNDSVNYVITAKGSGSMPIATKAAKMRIYGKSY